MSAVLSAWPERRPARTESERAAIAEQFSAHLPKPNDPVTATDADLDAMRAAFIRRFDEQLPRTETLMCIAHIGYRMALRDLALAAGTGTAKTRNAAECEASQSGPKGNAQPSSGDTSNE